MTTNQFWNNIYKEEQFRWGKKPSEIAMKVKDIMKIAMEWANSENLQIEFRKMVLILPSLQMYCILCQNWREGNMQKSCIEF
ncbi:MAG TPA: hypothetical protein EYP22_10680 [Methanosarcinales archaeon]|nr:hypothetical protein [Methanosarcinales archaeon]